MIVVSDILKDVRVILGACDETLAFERITDATEILAAKAPWDPTLGNIDICVKDGCITLPPEVEVPLAVNIGGRPAVFRNKWFEFHLNGPGSECSQGVDWAWEDKSLTPIVNDPTQPVAVVAFIENAADEGLEIRVYGYDAQDRWIMTPDCDGVLEDGFLVPTVYGYPLPNPDAPLVKRITRVRKDVSQGFVRLSTWDEGRTDGGLLGLYRPSDTEPSYYRIRIKSSCTWVRIKFKKKSPKITSIYDVIPLASKWAILLMLKALKKFEEDRLDEGVKYESQALRLLDEKESASEGPETVTFQVMPGELSTPVCDQVF